MSAQRCRPRARRRWWPAASLEASAGSDAELVAAAVSPSHWRSRRRRRGVPPDPAPSRPDPEVARQGRTPVGGGGGGRRFWCERRSWLVRDPGGGGVQLPTAAVVILGALGCVCRRSWPVPWHLQRRPGPLVLLDPLGFVGLLLAAPWCCIRMCRTSLGGGAVDEGVVCLCLWRCAKGVVFPGISLHHRWQWWRRPLRHSPC
jgi:hypothetical protein